MPTYKLLILFISFFLLSACGGKTQTDDLNAELSKTNKRLSSQNEKLIKENLELINKLNVDYSKQLIQLEKMEREAAITLACTQPFNINFCPLSITKVGEDAIQMGVSGAANKIFWTVYSFKLISMIFVFGLPLIIFIELWSRRFKPNLEAVSNAESLVVKAEKRLQELEGYKKTTADNILRLSAELIQKKEDFDSDFVQHQDELDALKEKIKAKTSRLEFLDQQNKSREAAIHALEAFKV